MSTSLIGAGGAIDLNHAYTHDRAERDFFSRCIVERIDAAVSPGERLKIINAILADIEANPPELDQRPGRSVSASAVGDECMRRVQLNIWESFHPGVAIARAPIDAKTAAIFERGHRTEPLMAEWLRLAGFDLSTHQRALPDWPAEVEEKQHGFRAAGGQIKGYADGVVRSALFEGLVLWENKTLGDRSWKANVRHGVVKQTPKYDAQVQLLMAYMDMPFTLFTLLNADTGDIYAELVKFDEQRAQAVSDRAVFILRATRAGELLPRVASNADVFPCKQCKRFRDACWE
jgi:hypothetical protein